MVEIREVDYGVANNFGTYIEINKHLKTEFPELHAQILAHELSHTDKPGFAAEDLMIDLGQKINTFQMVRFMIRHPKALYQLRPVYKQDGYLVYDFNMILMWIFSIGLTIGVIYGIGYLL
jgi:hypothetical protein